MHAKSEIRSTKSETNPKGANHGKGQTAGHEPLTGTTPFWIFLFSLFVLVSDFGFRISDLGCEQSPSWGGA
jgi:hypothetical protein